VWSDCDSSQAARRFTRYAQSAGTTGANLNPVLPNDGEDSAFVAGRDPAVGNRVGSETADHGIAQDLGTLLTGF